MLTNSLKSTASFPTRAVPQGTRPMTSLPASGTFTVKAAKLLAVQNALKDAEPMLRVLSNNKSQPMVILYESLMALMADLPSSTTTTAVPSEPAVELAPTKSEPKPTLIGAFKNLGKKAITVVTAKACFHRPRPLSLMSPLSSLRVGPRSHPIMIIHSPTVSPASSTASTPSPYLSPAQSFNQPPTAATSPSPRTLALALMPTPDDRLAAALNLPEDLLFSPAKPAYSTDSDSDSDSEGFSTPHYRYNIVSESTLKRFDQDQMRLELAARRASMTPANAGNIQEMIAKIQARAAARKAGENPVQNALDKIYQQVESDKKKVSSYSDDDEDWYISSSPKVAPREIPIRRINFDNIDEAVERQYSCSRSSIAASDSVESESEDGDRELEQELLGRDMVNTLELNSDNNSTNGSDSGTENESEAVIAANATTQLGFAAAAAAPRQLNPLAAVFEPATAFVSHLRHLAPEFQPAVAAAAAAIASPPKPAAEKSFAGLNPLAAEYKPAA